MIRGPGMRMCGALALAACIAAWRFVSRRGKAQVSASRSSWLPMALRWRRTQRRRGAPPAQRATPAIIAAWLPRFHFHFDVRAIDRPERRASPGGLAAVLIHHARRIVARHHPASLRSVTVAMDPRRKDRAPRAVGVTSPAAARELRDSRPAGARLSWSALAALFAPRVAHRPRHALVVSAHARLLPRALAVRQLRPSGFSGPLRELHEHPAPVVRRDLPVELVWRAPLRPAAGVAVEVARADLPPPSQRASTRSFVETASEPTGRGERMAPAPLINLDPTLLDRLTDHVIRRVERRARIERERRGL